MSGWAVGSRSEVRDVPPRRPIDLTPEPMSIRRAAALLCFLLAPAIRAQDTASTANLRPSGTTNIAVLTLVDGSRLQGRVLEVTPTTIRFASAMGETVLPRGAVREVRVMAASAMHDGEVWPEDPSRSRLFFAPTGRTLRKGESYFADAYIFLPSFQTGLTDNLTIGAGMSIIPFIGLEHQAYYLTPKLGVLAGPNVNVSVGALIAGQGDTDQSPFGIVYGVGTFGGEDANVSVGGGVAYNRGTADNAALLMVGGSTRVSRGIALVSENYFYTRASSTALLSGGIRFIGDQLSVDLAAFTVTGDQMYPIPYVAFLYRY